MDAQRDTDLESLVAELTTTLRELQSEARERESRGPVRPPTPRELLRFTDEVGIPAAILVLEANIRALELLRRTIRLAGGRPPRGSADSGATATGERVEELGRATLERVDGALADLQAAIEGRPEDGEARDLLRDARELRAEIDARLEEAPDGDGGGTEVDVEAELDSIRDEVDREDG